MKLSMKDRLNPNDAPKGYGAKLRAELRGRRNGCVDCYFNDITGIFCDHHCQPKTRTDECPVIFIRVKPKKKHS